MTRFNINIEEGFAIYCGMFSINRQSNEFFTKKEIWNKIAVSMGQDPDKLLEKNGLPKEVTLTTEERKDMQTLYYDGLINCIYPDIKTRTSKSYQYTHHYTLPIESEIKLLDSETSPTINIVAIDFYILSKDQLIYTIETNLQEKTLEEIALQNYIVRNVEYYQFGFEKKNISSDFLKLFVPIIEIHNCLNGEHIPTNNYSQETLKEFAYTLFRGNKLKTYMIMQLPTSSTLFTDGYSIDNLLYELATCNKSLGVMLTPSDINYPDEKYYNQLIENNTIACFANWKGIALLDSFVVLFQPNNKIGYNWKVYYFRYLYINALCIRSFLVLTNEKYKQKNITTSIEHDFLMFDKTFNFHTVSYNFLPDIIYKKMRFGLEINEELEELKSRISSFSEKQDRENEKAMNIILFWLAILTLFSAFSDGLQLFIADISNCIRIILLCTLSIMIIICIWYKFRRRI
ncbi:hypothetical protein [Bacteroides bouchesdurhonensis]